MPLRTAILGLGFMGRTHAGAYARAAASGAPVQVVAVVDPNATAILAEMRGGSSGGGGGAGGNIATGATPLDAASVRIYSRPEEAFNDAAIDAVSICTYTDTHAPLAIAAIEAGKHALIEKPVALRSADVARVRDVAASRPHLVAMPAMCMRFWPGWDWLKDRIADREFGPLRSLTLTRLGAGPTWSSEFYRDVSRSGGALFDLHVHDTDFVYHCFGKPSRVTSAGNVNHITTLYHFDGLPGVHVAAEGAWDLQPGAAFRMRYFAHFERASAEWDIAKSPNLTIYEGAASRTIGASAALQTTGYDAEVRHFVEVCNAAMAGQPRPPLRATLDDAVMVTQVLEEEQRAVVR